jgi:hypothetical protein
MNVANLVFRSFDLAAFFGHIMHIADYPTKKCSRNGIAVDEVFTGESVISSVLLISIFIFM